MNPYMPMAALADTSNGIREQRQQQPPGCAKRSRNITPTADNSENVPHLPSPLSSSPSPSSPSPPPVAPSSMSSLPLFLVGEIATFSAGGSLSAACKMTLEAIRELHYKINILGSSTSFSQAQDPSGALSAGHMGLQPNGMLATGRVVTRITVWGCADKQDQKEGYEALEEAVKRVIQHATPTLRSITIRATGVTSCNRVSAVLGALVPLSRKQYREAPNLTRVELVGGPSGVAKAGRAIAAGLWPALEELIVARCGANPDQFKQIARGISSGRVPKLRVLNWDRQTYHRRRPLDDVLLLALSAGRCPLIESLSFTGNHFCPEFSILYIWHALRACPRLMELRMDCSRTPRRELNVLTEALRAGEAPRLASLFVRSTKTYHASDKTKPAVRALLKAAADRNPPIQVEVKVKTGYPRAAAAVQHGVR